MDTVFHSMRTWDRSLNDVTRLCVAATTGCFLVGGALLLADYFVPLAPRGIALLAVGGFFLAHGVFEFAKHRWSLFTVTRAQRSEARGAAKRFASHLASEPNEQAAA
jgi:CHASE2 domain-containing sensor protein